MEEQLQKLENNIRIHIRNEQQLKQHSENLEIKLDDMIKDFNKFKKLTDSSILKYQEQIKGLEK